LALRNILKTKVEIISFIVTLNPDTAMMIFHNHIAEEKPQAF
jgi:hypothetical protein